MASRSVLELKPEVVTCIKFHQCWAWPHHILPPHLFTLPLLLEANLIFCCKAVNQVTYLMFFQSPEPFTVLLFTLCCHRGATLSFQPLCSPHPDSHSKLSFPRPWGHFRPTEVVCKGRKITAVIFSSLQVVQPLL